MSERNDDPSAEPEDPDLGEPIAALADLAIEPEPGLIGRIRRSIRRRLFVAEVADFSWSGPRQVLAEFLRLIFGIFDTGKTGNGDRGHD